MQVTEAMIERAARTLARADALTLENKARIVLESVLPDVVQRAQDETAAKILQELELWADGLSLPECFYVWKNGEALAVPPDRLTGVGEALAKRLRESRDYSLFDSLTRRADQAEGRAARLWAQVQRLRIALGMVRQAFVVRHSAKDRRCLHCQTVNGHSPDCAIGLAEAALGGEQGEDN